ncbi:hypothetical protein [Myxococcus qinghaiensis]|uniref:hypothetical protein n=1 Tax=Myxococcus qinghaiensis TaxID=2906758 RepID=UPI0020A6E2F7|nr:hypothetical protein [Myxococcus qinghaiensis]MCP3166450.1 hypothetical protein [Myxococcus qinghaiensis]
MKLLPRSLFAGVAALVLAPLSASALPPDCSQDRCNASEPCWLVCALPWSMKVITCEEWVTEYEYGTCDASARAEEEDELSSSESSQVAPICAQPMLAARAVTQ